MGLAYYTSFQGEHLLPPRSWRLLYRSRNQCVRIVAEFRNLWKCFHKTHNQYPKEYHDLNKRCCELWREEMSSLNLSNHQSKEWEWKAIVLTFHHRFANVPYHHNNLISRIIPAPDTLMMGVVCLDERMIWHSHTPKVPLILGGCCMKYLVLLVQKIWMFTQ